MPLCGSCGPKLSLRALWAQRTFREAFSQGPLGSGGAERGGAYPLKPRILGSNTMTRLLEAGPLPALLFEPTSGRVGLDRVQYARPNGSVRLESTYPPPNWTEGVL